MRRMLLRLAVRQSLGQVRYVDVVRPRAATGTVREVYRQAEREFGVLGPPVALHSGATGPLAASWLMLRETLLVTGIAGRAAKEAVAAGVSRANSCPYCVEVHDAALRALPPAAGSAGLAEWAEHAAGPDGPPVPPMAAAAVPELLGVALTFHYLNRMANIFLDESPLPPHVPAFARGPAGTMLGAVLRSRAQRPLPPGASLELLPSAALPADLSWAAGQPRIADALARAAAAVDEAAGHGAAGQAVPATVRELVTAELAAWTGEPRGISRAWTRPLVSRLPEPDRPAGLLALLTAFASYQVDADVVGAVHHRSDDRSLLSLTSWASLAAARRGAVLAARTAAPAATA